MTNKLVAYFSASGTTAEVAEKVAQAAGADLFEIVPEKPYTSADLDWANSKSRTTWEMKDHPEFRPEVASKVDDMSQYDTVFIGFPIWWYIAPTIINTFLEQYDMGGKTIVLFATSGGSGMGKSIQGLQPSAPGAKFGQEKLMSAYASQADIDKWVASLSI